MATFSHTLVVHMSETDAAGIVFFSRYYDYAHICYEEFLKSRGIAISKVLSAGNFLLPIIHSSADYKIPLRLDQQFVIHLSIQSYSTSSYSLEYQFYNEDNCLLCQVKTVHVAISAATKQKIPLPDEVIDVIRGLE